MSGKQNRAPMTEAQAKSAAKNVKARMDALGADMTLGRAYEAVAAANGYADWSTMRAALNSPSATPDIGMTATDPTAALKENLRLAVRGVAGARSRRPLTFDVRNALHAAILEATPDMDAVKALATPFDRFINAGGDRSKDRFITAFRVFLGQYLIPQIGETITEAFSAEVRGELARTLVAVELLLEIRFGRNNGLALMADRLDYNAFVDRVNWIESNERLTIGSARDKRQSVRFGAYEIKVRKLTDNMLSIQQMMRYSPEETFARFISERNELIGAEISVVHPTAQVDPQVT